MCGAIKTLKHNLWTMLRRAYHCHKNLAHTSKTCQVKRPKRLQLLGSRFACLLLQSPKNRTQRNRRAKCCEVLNQNHRQKAFNRGLYICAGGLHILKI